jgi:molybdate transport system substrate-binding protein
MNQLLKRTAFAAALAAVLPLAACGSDDNASADSGGSGGSGSGSGSTTLTVFAAASLTNSFDTLGKEFEKEHDGVTVKFSYGGSSDLVTQIQNGAPADVFASADEPNMDKLGDAAVDRTDFASNTLEIAVPPDNPAQITNLGGLTRPGVKVVVCAAPVPCGSATQKLEQVAGVTLKPVSEEQSVTDVLGKVESGEADAGIVYVTDVKGAGDKVKGVTISEAGQVVNTYPIAALKDAKNAELAKEFVDFVATGAGQQTLADAGFAKP